MEEYIRKQYLMSKITAICSVCMLVLVLGAGILILPRAWSMFGRIDTALTRLDTMSAKMEQVMVELEPGINGLQRTAEKLEELDFSSMIETLDELKSVIEPMGKLFGR